MIRVVWVQRIYKDNILSLKCKRHANKIEMQLTFVLKVHNGEIKIYIFAILLDSHICVCIYVYMYILPYMKYHIQHYLGYILEAKARQQ